MGIGRGMGLRPDPEMGLQVGTGLWEAADQHFCGLTGARSDGPGGCSEILGHVEMERREHRVGLNWHAGLWVGGRGHSGEGRGEWRRQAGRGRPSVTSGP